VPVSEPPLTYLDHAATTPLRAAARAAMEPWLGGSFGNPTGSHRAARAARRAVDDARDVVADAIGARPSEVVFTSGGTEADNLAIGGVASSPDARVWCSAIEHPAVLAAAERHDRTLLGVGTDGRIDLAELDDRLAKAVALGELPAVVSVMTVNNETGMVQPVAGVVERVRAAAPGVPIHTDAVQGLPWLDLARHAADADLVAVSAHKVGGPQGVGALVVRNGVVLTARSVGGGQEQARRSGTHNVAGIVGFGAAVAELVRTREALWADVARRRDRLADGLLTAVPDAVETGVRAGKVAGTCHLCIPGIEAEALLFLLDRDGLCATAASSCASGALEPSHVLAAMGIPRELAAGSLRLSLGHTTTDADIDRALELIPAAVARLRSDAS
jgi:cysteine desulfurase